jgi:hypothetical protein
LCSANDSVITRCSCLGALSPQTLFDLVDKTDGADTLQRLSGAAVVPQANVV